jgi:hypothetical protein
MREGNPVSLVGMMADINWQIAKGYLLAAVAAHGAESTGLPTEETKFRRLEKVVEAFVKQVEDEELNI